MQNLYKLHLKKEWMKRFYFPAVQWIAPARNLQNRILLTSNESGKFQLHARDFTKRFSRQLTRTTDGTLFGSISPNGRFVYFLKDISGEEHGHFVRIPFSGGIPIDVTPHLPRYYSYGLEADDLGQRGIFTASMSNQNKVYLISDLNEKRPKSARLIFKTFRRINGSIISSDGNYTCITTVSSKSNTSSEIFLIDNNTHQIIKDSLFLIKGSFTPLSFSQNHDEHTILGIGNTKGYYRPAFVNLNKKKAQIKNSNFAGDVFVLNYFQKERKLLLCEVNEASHKLILYDLNNNRVYHIGPTHGSFDLFFNSAALLPDKSILIRWQAFEAPACILKLSPPSYLKFKNAVSKNRILLPERTFQSVWVRSSDGTRVQMWVALPEKRKATIPFIIDIHGGPHGIVSDEFLPEAHAWLDHGFGYCAVNYRGSIGFGKKFQEKIYGNPGYWEVEDVIAVRNWLVNKKLADPNHIVISGWSWGGYVTLLALGKYPNLWKVGIAGMPITDFHLQYEDEPAFFKSLDMERFGGTPKEVPNRYKRSSPITYVKNFKVPVFIVYGENDMRCPPRQILHFKLAMEKNKKTIKIKKDSSGHASSFTNTKVRIANLSAAIKFAIENIKKYPSSFC